MKFWRRFTIPALAGRHCVLTHLPDLCARGRQRKGSTAKRTGYFNLSIGVYDDERMDDLPAKIELDGTFRKLTSIQWNPETSTMRFNPRNQGVGTLVIKDPKTGEVLAEYTIDIRKTDLQKVAREIQTLLQGIEGIQVRPEQQSRCRRADPFALRHEAHSLGGETIRQPGHDARGVESDRDQ